jgi:hypothetical protein
MRGAVRNERELVKVYAEQIGAVAKRDETGENVENELEEILSKAFADFARTEGVSQSEAIQALADRLDNMSTTATSHAHKVFRTARQMALHKLQDPGDVT